jgi:hypothetical protein
MAVQEDHGLFRHGTELRLRDIFVLFREFLSLLCAVRVVRARRAGSQRRLLVGQFQSANLVPEEEYLFFILILIDRK